VSGHLSARSEQVLKIVVEGYVAMGQPVGSTQVLATSALDCSSATIRNEMVRLMEAGYIEQPHRSAGRIPTDSGYRHYVDHLMSVPARAPVH
jgi:heat-inducible transcriptional repressor